MANFYQIQIALRDGVSFEEVKKKFDLAIDWYRNGNWWIVYTTSDAAKWYERLQQFVKPGGFVVIIKLDISDYYGYAPKELWDWLGKDRSGKKNVM